MKQLEYDENGNPIGIGDAPIVNAVSIAMCILDARFTPPQDGELEDLVKQSDELPSENEDWEVAVRVRCGKCGVLALWSEVNRRNGKVQIDLDGPINDPSTGKNPCPEDTF